MKLYISALKITYLFVVLINIISTHTENIRQKEEIAVAKTTCIG
jgi:hypothetical protein